ncbi:MAG: hypothetical protein M3Q60_06445 [Actinomycetota bacterium]|nr:hypothetical protein [Actinomycetota bacterium]
MRTREVHHKRLVTLPNDGRAEQGTGERPDLQDAALVAQLFAEPVEVGNPGLRHLPRLHPQG